VTIEPPNTHSTCDTIAHDWLDILTSLSTSRAAVDRSLLHNLGMHLSAMDLRIRWSINPQSHTAAANVQDMNLHRCTDAHHLRLLPAQYQHLASFRY
jgi:hypothetical protein